MLRGCHSYLRSHHERPGVVDLPARRRLWTYCVHINPKQRQRIELGCNTTSAGTFVESLRRMRSECVLVTSSRFVFQATRSFEADALGADEQHGVAERLGGERLRREQQTRQPKPMGFRRVGSTFEAPLPAECGCIVRGSRGPARPQGRGGSLRATRRPNSTWPQRANPAEVALCKQSHAVSFYRSYFIRKSSDTIRK